MGEKKNKWFLTLWDCVQSNETISIHFRLKDSKLFDAIKAIQEYSNKQGISEVWLANLYKSYAVLLLINNHEQSLHSALDYLKKANKIFSERLMSEGVAVSKYLISATQYSIYFANKEKVH